MNEDSAGDQLFDTAIFVGYLMSKLDVFLSNNAVSIEKYRKSANAIVLGRTVLASI
jgi:hypothetical protein